MVAGKQLDVATAGLIVGKPTPTGFWVSHGFALAAEPVGAGLPAIAVVNSQWRAAMESEIRLTTVDDWQCLKQVRLAALLDAPKAFGVSHETASCYTDEQWRQRASSTGTAFWLALVEGRAVGMVGAALGEAGRFNLIGLWLEPDARGYGLAARLVLAVKARAVEQGHERVFLDVAPGNAQAVRLYQQQGFVFLDEWEALESHPQVRVRGMVWIAPSLQPGPLNQAND